MADETQNTLRDSIESSVEAVETRTPETTSVTIRGDGSQPDTRTAEQRSRDEQGRFSQKDKTNVTTVPVQQAVQRSKPQRPSSWKKDYWSHWDKLSGGESLTPEEAIALAEYTAQREQDYSKGVSTYKGEWDKAKPVLEALTPIAPMVQQHGFSDTNHWLQTAVGTFRSLSSGSPQQKLGTLFQIAAHYQVPLEEIFEQDENGRFYLNPQKFQAVQGQRPQTQSQSPDTRKVVEEILMERDATKQVADLASDKEKYPHLEQVRETMAGLLRAQLVEDLPSAYQAALRMPHHKELLETVERQQREADEKRLREEQVNTVTNARAKVVSPKSSTPATTMKNEKGKGIRSSYEDAVNNRLGRV